MANNLNVTTQHLIFLARQTLRMPKPMQGVMGMEADEAKRILYDNGKYVIEVPPVCTANWTDEDWIKHIDLNKGWR